MKRIHALWHGGLRCGIYCKTTFRLVMQFNDRISQLALAQYNCWRQASTATLALYKSKIICITAPVNLSH